MTNNDAEKTVDRADTEAVLYRVAISAFTYYEGKELEEPGYRIDEDVAWCLRPLDTLDDARLTELCGTVARLITDPTADRQVFIATLNSLAGGQEHG